MTTLYNRREQRAFRRHLRRKSQPAERLLWSQLRKRQVAVVRFCRQYGIGRYVADFYAPEFQLVIEADGRQHHSPKAVRCDRARTQFMNSIGIVVLRFDNEAINENLEGAMNAIRAAVEARRSELDSAGTLRGDALERPRCSAPLPLDTETAPNPPALQGRPTSPLFSKEGDRGSSDVRQCPNGKQHCLTSLPPGSTETTCSTA